MTDHPSKWAAYAALAVAIAVSIFVFFIDGGVGQHQQRAPSSGIPSTITVAVVPAPPITVIDPATQKASGYAVEVVDAAARNSGIKVTYVPASWATMGAALTSGQADVVIGPIFMTEGRAREFGFSDPLFAYAIVAVVPRGSTRVQALSDLKMPGLRISVGRGGFDAEFVGRNMPNAKTSVFPPDDPTLPMLEVVAGRADLALIDYQTAVKFVAAHSETEIRFDTTPVAVQYAGFMLRQQDSALRDFLNLALRNLDVSGDLSAIDEKYAPQRAWYGRVSFRPTIVR